MRRRLDKEGLITEVNGALDNDESGDDAEYDSDACEHISSVGLIKSCAPSPKLAVSGDCVSVSVCAVLAILTGDVDCDANKHTCADCELTLMLSATLVPSLSVT